jgi:hypothetical protein
MRRTPRRLSTFAPREGGLRGMNEFKHLIAALPPRRSNEPLRAPLTSSAMYTVSSTSWSHYLRILDIARPAVLGVILPVP